MPVAAPAGLPQRSVAGGREAEFAGRKIALLAIWTGVLCGMPGIAFYSFGPLVQPLTEHFGSTRAAIQAALFFGTAGCALTAPFIGRLVDRFDLGVLAIASLLLLSLSLAATAFVGDSLWQLYLCYSVMAVAGGATTPILWTYAVSRLFESQRGFALGIALTGTGICAALAPKISAFGLSVGDWRTSYLLLAAAPMCLALPMVGANLLRHRSWTTVNARSSSASGLREIVAMRSFWQLAGAMFFIYSAVIGVIGNMVPLLMDKGLSLAQATNGMSALGISILIGRLGTGWLLDRTWAPGVGAATLLVPVIGCIILMFDDISPSQAILCAATVGLAAGSELDLMSFLTGKYFGLHNYGRVYGLLFAIFSVAGGVAPLVFAAQIASVSLTTAICLLSAASVLLLSMGPYPAASPGASPAA